MPVDLSGTWTEVRFEGWENILKALGIDPAKLPADMRVTEKITQTGEGAITIVSTDNKHPDFKREVTVTVGSNFTESVYGNSFECTTFWEGDKLIFQGVEGRGKMTRELVDGSLVVTVQIGSDVAKTFFEKKD